MKKVIFLSLIILFSVKTQNISANQNTFAVDNIIVSGELTGHNKNSREKYLNIGFRKAFKNLVIKKGDNLSFVRLKDIAKVEIGPKKQDRYLEEMLRR